MIELFLMRVKGTVYTHKNLWLFAIGLLLSFNESYGQALYASSEDTAFHDISEQDTEILRDLRINEIDAANLVDFEDEFGDFDDWIELYNFGDDTINLNGLYISDSKNNLTKFQISIDSFIPPKQFVLIWADEEMDQGPLHASFKLDSYGESIFLYDETIGIIDSITYPEITSDYTFGRLGNDFLSWNYFDNSTPGFSNPESGAFQMLNQPYSNQLSGFYSAAICVELDVDETVSTSIRYTLNGEIPTAQSSLYSSPICIDKTSTLRYRTFSTYNYLPSKTVSQSFFIDDATSLDVVSIVGSASQLAALFSKKTKGVEKPVHIDYFGQDRRLKMSIDGGLQLHSPKSNSQLSLRLYARSDYGFESMDYQFFENKNIHSFKRLVLRNSGNDGTVLGRKDNIHFRDGLHHTLYQDAGNSKESSSYKPVNVFINGVYKGIYNLRERIDKYFISSNFEYEGDMDLLERAFKFKNNRNAIEGSFGVYDSIMRYAYYNDLAFTANYEVVDQLMDVKQYADYWIQEVFVGNVDWMNNNIKMFRPHTDGSKLKWILWDTDHGSGLPYLSYGEPDWTTLSWSVSIDELRTGNGVENRIQRSLIKNEGFRNYFINRYADLLNTTYKLSNINYTIDSLEDNLKSDMKLHFAAWNLNYNNWTLAVNAVRNYYTKRIGYVRSDILSCFNLSSYHNVTLISNDQEKGTIKINTIHPEYKGNQWQGIYFSGVPISVEAIPKPGYRFSHWQSNSTTSESLTINSITEDTSIKAFFELIGDNPLGVVINEIKYTDDEYLENVTGWIELFNNTGADISLDGWTLATQKDTVVFSTLTIKNNSYLIIANSENQNFPDYTTSILSVDDFEIVSDDRIYLYNNKSELVDYVDLTDGTSWPTLPLLYNFSIELIDANGDNSNCEKWRSSTWAGGTPGINNSMVNDDLMSVCLNEVMAINNNVIVDEAGENDDWIELYNRSSKSVSLNGLFLSDDDDDPLKFQILGSQSEVALASGGFKIIWADDDEEQGVLHTNFKLSGEGEYISLYYNDGYRLRKIDELEYYSQIFGSSFGAIYDGINSDFSSLSFLNPTPAASNNYITNVPELTNESNGAIIIYPNPVTQDLFIRFNERVHGIETFTLFDLSGRMQKTIYKIGAEQEYKIDLSDVASGVYILRITGANHSAYFEKLIVK